MPIDTTKLRELREKRGLTQEEAAKRAKIGGKRRWYDYEAGRRTNATIVTLEKIAKVLGVHASELIK